MKKIKTCLFSHSRTSRVSMAPTIPYFRIIMSDMNNLPWEPANTLNYEFLSSSFFFYECLI